ncbi:MAG: sulfite exporter TauE/SafE family protein [Planctomycetota bacterium]|nr:sulfite exporter TauE/SafE family protein [Planctomycetota bacterium]
MDPAWIPLLTLIAFVAATISAIVGMGGGMVLLLAFYLVGIEPGLAIPLHGCVQLIANASRIWVYRTHARWRPILVFVLVSTPLPVLGLWLFRELPADGVKVVFGVLVLYATWAPPWGLRRLGPTPAMAAAGIVGGTFGVVVGANGPLIAPFLLHSEMKKEQLVATQAMCAAWLHVIKIVAFSTIGFAVLEHGEVILPLGVVVILGAFAGRWALSRISEARFRSLYRIVLTLLALRLMLRPWI